MAKRGRPGIVKVRVFTEAEYEMIFRCSQIGLTRNQIAHLLSLTVATFDRIIADNERIYDAIQRGKAHGIGAVAEGLFKNAVDKGNLLAQIFYLKTQARWSEPHEKPTASDDPDSKPKTEITLNYKPKSKKKLK